MFAWGRPPALESAPATSSQYGMASGSPTHPLNGAASFTEDDEDDTMIDVQDMPSHTNTTPIATTPQAMVFATRAAGTASEPHMAGDGVLGNTNGSGYHGLEVTAGAATTASILGDILVQQHHEQGLGGPSSAAGSMMSSVFASTEPAVAAATAATTDNLLSEGGGLMPHSGVGQEERVGGEDGQAALLSTLGDTRITMNLETAVLRKDVITAEMAKQQGILQSLREEHAGKRGRYK